MGLGLTLLHLQPCRVTVSGKALLVLCEIGRSLSNLPNQTFPLSSGKPWSSWSQLSCPFVVLCYSAAHLSQLHSWCLPLVLMQFQMSHYVMLVWQSLTPHPMILEQIMLLYHREQPVSDCFPSLLLSKEDCRTIFVHHKVRMGFCVGNSWEENHSSHSTFLTHNYWIFHHHIPGG